MDDLSEKLASVLNDPQQMEQMRRMAEQLLGGGETPTPESPPTRPTSSGLADSLFEGIGAEDLGRMMGLLSRFRQTGQDDRTRLLLALKPHLSEPRQEKINTAVKLLKLIELLPFLKESGLFSGLGG